MKQTGRSNEDQKARALTAAALVAAKSLGLAPAETARVIGVSEGAMKSFRDGSRVVDGANGEAEYADSLVKVVGRLKTLLGPEETKWRSWLRSPVPGLEGKPIEILMRRGGIVSLREFLERN